MKILMISGKSGSGKDTFANIMREKLEKQDVIVLLYIMLIQLNII